MSADELSHRPWKMTGVRLLTMALALLNAPAATLAQEPTQPADSAAAEQEEDEGLPLDPARTLEFTTDKASWISLDVSPDGETIVFGILGDLYMMPLEGGQARQFTSGLAFDSEPRFSPDGSRVAFISDRSGAENVWILSVDGTDTVQVTEGTTHRYQSPEWTPDGDYIIASRAGVSISVPKLWMYHVDGGTGIQLIEEPEPRKTIGAAFGANPRYIWFAERRGGWDYNAMLPQYQLGIYDRETGETYRRSSRYGSGFRPTLSPDGQWLVYGTRFDEQTGLRIRNLETGDERWLMYPVQHDVQEGRATRGALPGMSFTPDSRAVLFTRGGGIWRVPVDGGAPGEIPFSADVNLAVGPMLDFEYPISDSPGFTIRQIRDIAPSPDGGRLAFTALDRLYVMELPDGEPETLAPMDAVQYQPVWSPNGEWIAFGVWDKDEGGHLYRIQPDGGDLERLTERPAMYRQPAWSPDGARIVTVRTSAEGFRTDNGSRADLVWIPADGGPATRVAPTNGRGTPHFSNDPDRIYVYDFGDGLVSMRWDGTDLQEHLNVTGERVPGSDNPRRARTILISPDGETALAMIGMNLYVVTVPPFARGETPTISVANPENAKVPVRRLTPTELGGQFPVWGDDGGSVHWALGNAHFVYDLSDARAARAAAEDAPEAEDAGANGEDDGPVYEPVERRIEIVASRDNPQGVAVLRGARIITMRGENHEEVIEEGAIVVRNNRIEAVGQVGQVRVPEGAEVIDVSGTTIMPGFVDTHAHLRPNFGVHREQVWQYLANLAYGVTTTRDPQTGTTDVLTYSDRVRSGDLIGPRIYSTGPGVFWSEQIGSLDDAREVLSRYSEYYHTKTIKMYMSGNRQMRQWIIMAARELELMPTTEGGLDFKMDLTQIIDGYPGHEHSFPIYPLYGDIVTLLTEMETAYTPTLLVSYGGPWAENYYYSRHNPHDSPKLNRFFPHQELDSRTLRRGAWFREEQHVFEDHARFVADLIAAGGQAGVGSHGQLQGLGYHWELWSIQSGGLSEMDALKIATVFGAEAIGLAEDLGTIAPGMLADFLVLEDNPLEDIRNTLSLRYVVKNGRIYEADTLNEIWPRQRPLEGMWWWNQTPRPLTTAASARHAGDGTTSAPTSARTRARTRARHAADVASTLTTAADDASAGAGS